MAFFRTSEASFTCYFPQCKKKNLRAPMYERRASHFATPIEMRKGDAQDTSVAFHATS
jgi:hypothetical protein